MWLEATKLGLAVQPVTGLLFLAQRIGQEDSNSVFTNKQIKLIAESYSELKQIFGLDGEVIAMMFRIGHAKEPSARSSRMKPEDI